MAVLTRLPSDLPVPVDDGAADHLVGTRMPPIALPTTAGRKVDFSSADGGLTVIFAYPMTGRPDRPIPAGWELIPGAPGCTLQACTFRDHHQELGAFGARVFALSTQEPDYQAEMAERLHLTFEVVSDAAFELTDELRLPTFEVAGMRLLRRLTLVLARGVIEHVFYPVFPPDESAAQVVDWLRTERGGKPAS